MPTAPARGWRQLARFAAVGIGSNALLYGVFLLLLHAGVGAIVAMTCTYIGALALSFAVNRTWTFGDRGHVGRPLRRYLLVQAACYGLNALLLHGGVDLLGWPAAAVQAAAIVLVAAVLFVCQKYWVFGPRQVRTG